MQAKTVYIFINGIFTKPGDDQGWTDRAVTWMHLNCENARGEKYEYYTDAITRRWKQAWRADRISNLVGFYRRSGFRVVLIGHSNGCDLIARVIENVGQDIDTAHLFSPATDAWMFEQAIVSKVVRRVHVYGSINDRALLFARRTRPLIGWLGLGYGYLGLEGRSFAKQFPKSVFDHSNDEFDHGTWFTRGSIFENTMQLLLANDMEDVKILPL